DQRLARPHLRGRAGADGPALGCADGRGCGREAGSGADRRGPREGQGRRRRHRQCRPVLRRGHLHRDRLDPADGRRARAERHSPGAAPALRLGDPQRHRRLPDPRRPSAAPGPEIVLPARNVWGGGPPEGWGRGKCRGLASYPSTPLRGVPLPIWRWGGFMIGLPQLYLLAGAMFAAFAVLSALDRTNRKRFGNAAFWALIALSF